jgi:hypothetical protein
MADATLRKLVTNLSVTTQASVADLVKKSGILQNALVIPSSHGKFHKYKKVSALPTASFRNIGGSYTDQTVNDEIHQLDLKMCGLIQSEDKAICDEIGVRKYFEDNRPAIMASMGQKMSTGIVYGTNATYGDASSFLGWHEIAQANGSGYYATAGGTTNTTTIFIVKFEGGVNGNGVVFNSKTMNGGNLISTQVLNNAKPVLEYTGSGTKKPVYQVLYETDLAYLSSSVFSIYALYGVDTGSNVPTDAELKLGIDAIKASPADSMIFTSRMGKRGIETLNISDIQTTPETDDYNNLVERYNGIKIVVDENILETEATTNLPY